MTYDESCLDLAKQFLSDCPEINTPENAEQLAQDIQITIEDFIFEKHSLLKEEG